LSADARDVAHLTVKIVDEHGNVVPTARNLVTFVVQGAGALIGVDNGDPASHEDYRSNRREAFNGLCLAIVQTTREPGKLRVAARADGLKEAAVDLDVQKPTVSIPILP
jgi:beta-galactosidase